MILTGIDGGSIGDAQEIYHTIDSDGTSWVRPLDAGVILADTQNAGNVAINSFAARLWDNRLGAGETITIYLGIADRAAPTTWSVLGGISSLGFHSGSNEIGWNDVAGPSATLDFSDDLLIVIRGSGMASSVVYGIRWMVRVIEV